MFKRVIIKVSGEMIGGKSGGFVEQNVQKIVSEVSELISLKTEVALVVGGGNFWRGRSKSVKMSSTKADQIGMVATVMNGIYLCEALVSAGVPSVAITPFSVNEFTEVFSVERAIKYLQSNTVAVFAGGTGHPFFTTDTIVSLRARELEADAVLFAKSNTNGVCDKDPNKYNDYKTYKIVSYETIIKNRLDFADASAISLLYGKDFSIPSVVFNPEKENGIVIACQNNDEIFNIGGTKVLKGVEDVFYDNLQ